MRPNTVEIALIMSCVLVYRRYRMSCNRRNTVTVVITSEIVSPGVVTVLPLSPGPRGVRDRCPAAEAVDQAVFLEGEQHS